MLADESSRCDARVRRFGSTRLLGSSAQHAAGARLRVDAGTDHRLAVHQYVADPVRIPVRVLPGRVVDDGVRVEHDERSSRSVLSLKQAP